MPAEKPKPLTKEEWLSEFRTEAGRLRELYMSKLVAAVALAAEWVKHRDEDPEKVAQAWAARQGPKSANADTGEDQTFRYSAEIAARNSP